MEAPIEATAARPSRRFRFSFSLRSLLLLCAVVAATVGVRLSQTAPQWRHVSAIRAAGGNVIYNDDFDGLGNPRTRGPKEQTIREFLLLRSPIVVLASGDGISDDLITEHVLPLETTQFVQLEGTGVSAAGAISLAELPNLKVLRWLRDSENEIVAAELDRFTHIDSVDTPLAELAVYIREFHRLKTPIRFDLPRLAPAGLNVNVPVTIEVKQSSLKLDEALDAMLKPLGMAWTVDHGTLMITTPQHVAEYVRDHDERTRAVQHFRKVRPDVSLEVD